MSSFTVQLNHVHFSYEKDVPILQDISFGMSGHDTIGLIGANGVGKSTLLKLLVGLSLDYTGEITVGEWAVKKPNLAQLRAHVGYVFQDSDSQLFLSTAYDDVAFAPQNYGYSEEDVAKKVRQAMELTGIWHLKDKPIYKMSGGEKKLCSIATILSMTPDLILLDEPSIALDPRNRRNLIHVLNTLPQPKIIATHDLDMVMDTCNRTILLSKGRIVCDGATKDILTNQALLEAHGLELPLCLSAASTKW